MSANHIIRPATPDDCNAIAALMTQLNFEEGHNVATLGANIALALFGQSRELNLQSLVADVGTETVGAMLYYAGYDTISASYGFHLADIIVTKHHRQSGVGTALMKALATRALADNKEWISLTVLARNHRAKEFYVALGMEKVDADFFAMGKTALAQL